MDGGRASWRFGLVLQPGFGLMGQAGWLDAVLVRAEGPWHGEPDQAAPQLLWLRQRAAQGCPMGGVGTGAAWLAEAVALMEANLGEPLPTEEIARLVGVSRRQLERLFKQHLDALPSRWYLELRLDRARDMLRQTHQSILQIALSCGFASGPHFSNAYRARYGHTPREERSPQAVAWRAAQSGVSLAPDVSAQVPVPDVPLGSPDEQNREIPAR